MLDYIQSSALRHYYDENNIQISDFDKATLIYNSGYPLLSILDSLQELFNRTRDLKLKMLIKNRLDYERKNIDILERADNGYVYELKIYQIEDNDYEQTAIFTNYELAKNIGKKYMQRFSIHKLYLYDSCDVIQGINNSKDIDNEVAYAVYNINGDMEYCWSLKYSTNTVINDISYKKGSFEDRGMYLRHPFRSGDRVLFKYNNHYIKGIVINQDSDEIQFSCEYLSDSAILILDENSIGSDSDRANHYHVLPMFIEYQKNKHK